MINDRRICEQESGNVRPVFVQLCPCTARDDCPRHIGTTSGKCVDISRIICTVKARNHGTRHFLQFFLQEKVGTLILKFSIPVKTDHFRSINKFIAEKISQQDCI